VLCAIDPIVKGKIETRTFRENSLAEMVKWLDSHQGISNLYFTVNTIAHDMNIKPKKTDIAAGTHLFVDCDPRVGEDPAEAKVRILKTLQNFSLTPTLIIDSGNGYQAYWKLTKSVMLDGTEAAAEDYEAYNRQLEFLFDGDHCHNADRLMRLPGTINMPTETKKRKGRVPVLASVLEWHDDRIYDLSQFTPAPSLRPSANSSGDNEVKVNISSDLTHVCVDDLAAKNINVPDPIKILIVHGHNPDNPSQYPSRSEPLFAVVCALVRAGANDATIAGVIMNRDNGISASVLDKRHPENYAEKQIRDAREEEDKPYLKEMNQKHAVIQSIGAKTRVLTYRHDPNTDRRIFDFQSFEDIRNFYSNKKVEIARDKDENPVLKPLGKWWLEHPSRRQYEGLCFAPCREVENYLNLWRGFGVTPKKGVWRRMRKHIWKVLATANRDAFKYIIRWSAWAVQNPGKQAEVALVFRGGKGTGKGTFARAMCQLFGQHGLHISSAAHFTGRFNNHLRDVCLLFADEAYAPEDRAAESRLKALITEPTMTIEPKGIDATDVPNHLHVIIAGNYDWVIPAGPDERRYAIFEAGNIHKQDLEYFDAIQNEISNGGLEAMLYDLLRVNLDNWHPRKSVPQNSALNQQKALSLNYIERVFFDSLVTGIQPPNARALGDSGGVLLPTMALVTEIERRTKRGDVTAEKVNTLLKTLGFKKNNVSRPRGFEIPPLPEARKAWDTKKFPMAWDDSESWDIAAYATLDDDLPFR